VAATGEMIAQLKETCHILEKKGEKVQHVTDLPQSWSTGKIQPQSLKLHGLDCHEISVIK
jgi:hypothetical protein